MGRKALPLTPKQQECFEHLSKGYPTSKMIGRAMNITPKMVDKHFAEACQRLGVTDRRAALVVWLAQQEDARGDDPPGETAPLSSGPSGGTLAVVIHEEIADHDEQMAYVGQEAATARSEQAASDSRLYLGGSGAAPLRDGAAIIGPAGDYRLAGYDREAIPVGSSGDDAPVDSRRSHRHRQWRIAPPGISVWFAEYELTGWQRLVLIALYAGAAGLAALIALLAAKAMIALL